MMPTLDELFEARFGRWQGADPLAVDNETMWVLAAHRSHRRFTPQQVSQSLLDSALAAAFTAPAKLVGNFWHLT